MSINVARVIMAGLAAGVVANVLDFGGGLLLQDDQIADFHRIEELQPVDGRRHDQTPRMPMTRDGAGDVDEVHGRAAEQEPERVRVVRQNDLDHLGVGIGRGPWREWKSRRHRLEAWEPGSLKLTR